MSKPIEQMAIQAGMNYYSMSNVFYTWNTDGVSLEMMKRLEEIIRKDEREACARIALKYEPIERQPYITYAADEIRARGKK